MPRSARLWLRWFVVICLARTIVSGPACFAQESAGSDRAHQDQQHEPSWLKGLTRISAEDSVWLHPQEHYVVVAGNIVLRDGALEMFACLVNTKEHESIVAVDARAFVVHTALLAAGARAGTPVQFYPEYRAATGTPVQVEVVWTDAQGKRHRENARQWIRDFRTGKPLDHDWVFGGSGFWTDPEDNQKHYHAEGGDLICVANFPTAMLDLPVQSSQLDADRLFQAFTERIPPLGTRVFLVLTPQKQAEAAKTGEPGTTEQGNLKPSPITEAGQTPPQFDEGSTHLQVEPGSTSAHAITVTDDDGQPWQMPYVLSVPLNYSPHNAPAPLILFLHGLGECGLGGDQLDRVKTHGPWQNKVRMDDFPFIVLAPQCRPPKPEDPETSYRAKWQVQPLVQLLDDVERQLNVDTRRVYLMGLSMGGYGTWRLAAAHPGRFAAAVPICGGGDPQTAQSLASLPIWAFHGQQDSVVPVSQTHQMIEAVRQAQGNPRMTIYPDADHDSWTQTFANPEVYKWLLSHRVQRAE